MHTLALLLIASATCFAAERYVGTVGKVEASPPALLIHLDGGGQKWIGVSPDTAMLRVAPGEKDIATAPRLRLDEVQAGDRVLVRTDGEPAIAGQVLVLSQSDLARKQQAERDDWKKRGVSGQVTAIAPDSGEVTINTAARLGSATVLVETNPKTEQRRYRADSARFSDARQATIQDIRVGDQIQALGERAPDGRTMTAEKIVSGTFRNFTATIEDLNPTEQRMLVRAGGHGPPFAVRIAPGSILRRLSAEGSAQLAKKNPDRSGAAGTHNILDGAVSLAPAEFRRGDAVVIATVDDAEGAAAGVTAIAVIAGVEPLLKRSAEEQKETLGSWNLSLDPESGDRGGRQ
jgi:hypothetical protein